MPDTIDAVVECQPDPLSIDESIDPLSSPFDLLVVGTGALESVVAAAASRSGAKVVHVDGNPFYGGVDATLPLVHAAELFAAALAAGQVGALGGRLRVHALAGSCAVLPARLAPAARRVQIDLRPRVTLARGDATELLVASGVARYLDYRALDGAFVAPQGGPPARVPASKGDVFLSRDLSLLDKRRLMKFLAAASDAAQAEAMASEGAGGAEGAGGGGGGAAASVLGLNEAVLGAGRSLLRPQNKRVVASGGGGGEGGEDEGPLSAHLATQGLAGALGDLLRFGVALDGGGLTARQGMARVRGYLRALGRYGSTAFLATLYGSGELPQAFCRLAAVHGAVYMLDVAPRSWAVVAGVARGVSERLKAGEGGEGDKVAVGTDAATPPLIALTLEGGQVLRARAALVSPQFAGTVPPALCAQLAGVALQRDAVFVACVCVTDAPLLGLSPAPAVQAGGAAVPAGAGDAPNPPSDRDSTVLVVLPPSGARHFPAYLLQQGHSTATAPKGLWVVSLWASLDAGPEGDVDNDNARARIAAALLVDEAARWVSGVSMECAPVGYAGPSVDGVVEGAAVAAGAPPIVVPECSERQDARPAALWYALYSIHGAAMGAAATPAAAQASAGPTLLVLREGAGTGTWTGCSVCSEALAAEAQQVLEALLPGAAFFDPPHKDPEVASATGEGGSDE